MTKTLVLLPGTMCDARLFTPIIEHFSARGWHIRVPAIYSPESNLDQLGAQILSCLPERFDLVGLSLGAVVAQHMLRAAPHRISHLAHLDANVRANDQPTREDPFSRVGKLGLQRYMQEVMLRRYLHEPNLHNATITNCVVDMALDQGLAIWRAQLDLLNTRFDASSLLSSSPVPTLLGAGEHDRIAPLSNLRKVSGANVMRTVYPASGHLPTLENPAAVITSLEKLFAPPITSQE